MNKCKGEHAFSVTGPRLWNELPLDVRYYINLNVFKCHLKVYLYSLAFKYSSTWMFSFFLFVNMSAGFLIVGYTALWNYSGSQ